jgi:hypothetical protein
LLTQSGDRSFVALHLPSATYLRLNRSAGEIADHLLVSGDPEFAAAQLSERYSISPAEAQHDVLAVLDRLAHLDRQPARRARRPRFDTALAECRSWWRHPAGLRVRVAETVLVLAIIEVGLRFWNLRNLSAAFGSPLSSERVEPAAPEVIVDDMDPRERLGFVALEWTLRRWIFDDTCLRRSLLTGFIIRRRHPVLRLGLTDDGVTAHAWVEADGWSYGASDSLSGVFVASAEHGDG